MQQALIGRKTISKSIVQTGILGLYSLDEWGTGYLVMSHNLNPLPHDFPGAGRDIRANSLKQLQKLARQLKARGVSTRFVHFAKPSELFVSKSDLDDFNQPLPNFWKCRCEFGAIHNVSYSLPGFCRRCGQSERNAPRAGVDEVFSELRLNFDQMRPVLLWEKDPGIGKEEVKYFFGGFASRRAAELAIAQSMETANWLTGHLPAGLLTGIHSPATAYINPERWIIEEVPAGIVERAEIALQS